MLCAPNIVDREVNEGTVELRDDFSVDCAAGAFVGGRASSGHQRLGTDVEGVMSIDNGALRIAPLIEAGFNRAAVAYGPFKSKSGLCFAVRMLNGHNTAQAEPLPDTFRERLVRWLKGSDTESKWVRLRRFIGSGKIRRIVRQIRWWQRNSQGAEVAALNENLAVGWFAKEGVQDPRSEGASFIMHALGPENGELRVGEPRSQTRALQGVQNLPLYLVAVLRPGGTVYYVSSMEGARGLSPYPMARPIGVDRETAPENVYLGIHQSVIGQIGFRIDTRVGGVRVAEIEGYDSWCGGAIVADTLFGEGLLTGTQAEIGEDWTVVTGGACRSADGAVADAEETVAVIETLEPVGMIHLLARYSESAQSGVGIVFRWHDRLNHWRFNVSGGRCEIVRVLNGRANVAESKPVEIAPKAEVRFQVLDDGHRICAYVDGLPVIACSAGDDVAEGRSGAGFLLDSSTSKVAVRNFEAHPRGVLLPSALQMGGLWNRQGARILLKDSFEGGQRDLHHRMIPGTGFQWSRTIGTGTIETTGAAAARVVADVQKPFPGRTAYVVDWSHPEFADLEVTITPSGSARGNKDHSTAGLIFYQDEDNYVICNFWLSDAYAGGSVSTFFRVRGYEDLYDAVWTNVGDRIGHGRATRLKLCCDGSQYVAYLDGEPVLYRAFCDVYPDFPRLVINKVGVVANWEWGCDTGSLFQEFKARI